MPHTHGGKRIRFEWTVNNDHLRIQNENGNIHTYPLAEVQTIIDWLSINFDNGWFPLANNVQLLSNGKERAGLGMAILKQAKNDISHAQGASYLGVVLEESGVFAWNGKIRGIEWKIIAVPKNIDQLQNSLSATPTHFQVKKPQAQAEFGIGGFEPSTEMAELLPDPKRHFLCSEFSLLSINAALATRDRKHPVYSQTKKDYQREPAKKAIRELLLSLGNRYGSRDVSAEDHFEFIQHASDNLSSSFRDFWHDGRFRIGVTQKLINLHLKYLWVAGFITEPPHCPIDGIVRDLAQLSFDWTKSDSLDEYRQAIADLHVVADREGHSLSRWELHSFNRRNGSS